MGNVTGRSPLLPHIRSAKHQSTNADSLPVFPNSGTFFDLKASNFRILESNFGTTLHATSKPSNPLATSSSSLATSTLTTTTPPTTHSKFFKSHANCQTQSPISTIALTKQATLAEQPSSIIASSARNFFPASEPAATYPSTSSATPITAPCTWTLTASHYLAAPHQKFRSQRLDL